jgi:hypothetical protein
MSSMVPPLDAARVVRLRLSAQAQADTSTAVREALAQIPEASTCEPGTMIAIPGDVAPERSRGLLGRIASIGPRPQVHRAMRCTGLLARGYVRIGAGADAEGVDWTWGYVPEG